MKRIVSLRADNFKRLRAVHIEPNGETVVISGRNGAGKSSVLDAIAAAIGGADLCPKQPIRVGEERAEVAVDLGDLIVRRIWTAGGTRLEVTTADGAKYPTPQKVMDRLADVIGLDPTRFALAGEAERREMLFALCGCEERAAELAAEIDDVYQQRRDAKREADRLAASVAAMGEPEAVDEVDTAALSAAAEELRAAAAAGEAQSEAADSRRAQSDIVDAESRVFDLAKYRIERLEETRAQLAQSLADAEAELDKERGQLEPKRRSLEGARQLLAERDREVDSRASASADAESKRSAAIDALLAAKETNRKAEAWAQYRGARADVKAAESKADALSDRLETLRAERRGLLSSSAVPGLSIDDSGAVLFNGVVFDQASAAERLRLSVTVAMARDPELRVILIRDASIFDAESLEAVQMLAVANGFQLWIEQVDTSGTVGVVIEDGEVI